MNSAGRTAIVSGGSGSIGRAIALRLAQEGCDIALIDLASTPETAIAIEGFGRRVFAYTADLAAAGQTRNAVAQAVRDLGSLDILVNAAGITSFGSAATLAEQEWDRVIDINLKGVFLACQAAIEPMKQRGGGRIVNIGSVLAKNGGNARPWLDPAEQQRSGNIAYGVSKAGVHVLTSYLSRELAGFGITVNAVAPGPIVSDMTSSFPAALKALIPVGRMGLPKDVADAVAFLAAPGTSYITGEILDVNGGLWSD
jgi:NAD(P)-dependent dehydrogenase (short-subunit alcohol dehydrogenase family)